MKAIIFDLDGTLLNSMHIWLPPQNRDTIAKRYKEEVVLKPGVFAFLENLRKNRIRMVLATATDRHVMEPAMRRNKIHNFFECIFTCREVGASKETPVIYHKALDFLGLDKEDVWVFEDAFYAVRTAKAAGFKVAAIQDDYAGMFNHGQDIQLAEIVKLADIYITDYTKLDLSQLI